MSQTGYYGDFSSYQEEEEARKEYEKTVQNEQNDLNCMTEEIDELVSILGYNNIEKYVFNNIDIPCENNFHDIDAIFYRLFSYFGPETVKSYVKSLKDKND